MLLTFTNSSTLSKTFTVIRLLARFREHRLWFCIRVSRSYEQPVSVILFLTSLRVFNLVDLCNISHIIDIPSSPRSAQVRSACSDWSSANFYKIFLILSSIFLFFFIFSRIFFISAFWDKIYGSHKFLKVFYVNIRKNKVALYLIEIFNEKVILP